MPVSAKTRGSFDVDGAWDFVWAYASVTDLVKCPLDIGILFMGLLFVSLHSELPDLEFLRISRFGIPQNCYI